MNTTTNVKKIIDLGKIDYRDTGHRVNQVTIEVELTDGKLSICGSIWNGSHTGVLSAGQNLEEIWKWFQYDPKIERIVDVWRRWHLNHLKAGCEHQRAAGWDKRPIDPSKPLDTYGRHFPDQTHDSWNMLGWVRPDEHPDGLLGKPCEVCGYRYGTAWLKEELPAEIIAEVLSW